MGNTEKDNSILTILEMKQGNLPLQGALTLATAQHLISNVQPIVDGYSEKKITMDLLAIETIDSAGVAALEEIIDSGQTKGIVIELTGIGEKLRPTISTFSLRDDRVFPEPARKIFFERLGEGALDMCSSVRDFLYLASDTFYWSIKDLFNAKGRLHGAVVHQCVLIGVDSLPIIGLLSFLIGLILALQSAAQLRQFGANIFVADLLVISMTREMGPLLTAVILAGRSGSAFASEIATMKVSEELDALKTMALNPIRFVVVPKFYAITLFMPLLTVLAIVIGVAGGFIVAITYLQLSPSIFMNEVLKVVMLRDFATGIVKSLVFAWLIVLIGSFYGFRATGGSAGVGIVTTKSVVAAIFMIIVADSVLGLLFYM
jgi:phospholipid/cholesterol/gamma-HCH transport system permease protein